MRKNLLAGIAGLLFLVLPSQAADNVIFFRGTTYGAIAYSEKTGAWGYAYDQSTRGMAEGIARRNCTGDDARAVGWVRNGFVALAVGENGAWGVGYSYGDGATNREAKERALEECRKRSKTARLVICVCSLDVKPEIFGK
jgi:serine/threonine-protein kinase